MKFSKYILNCACICAICSGYSVAEYDGVDKVELLEQKLEKEIKNREAGDKAMKEDLDKLNTALKEEFDKTKEQIAATQEQTENIKTEVNEIKQSQGSQEDINEKTEKLSQRVDAIEQKAESGDDSELKSKLDSLEEKVQKQNQELQKYEQELQNQKQEQSETNKQQNLTMAQNASEIEKLKRVNKAESVGNTLLGVLNSPALKDGIKDGIVLAQGVLSLFSSSNSNSEEKQAVREKVMRGEPLVENTEGMSDEEILKIRSMEEDIRSGKSDQEIQAEAEVIKNEIADRQEKEEIDRKFPKVNFFGLNEAFSSENIGETLLRIKQLSEDAKEAPRAERIISGNINPIDQEVIDTIYDMFSKGASSEIIVDRIGFHSDGPAMKSRATSPTSLQKSAQNLMGDHNAQLGTYGTGSSTVFNKNTMAQQQSSDTNSQHLQMIEQNFEGQTAQGANNQWQGNDSNPQNLQMARTPQSSAGMTIGSNNISRRSMTGHETLRGTRIQTISNASMEQQQGSGENSQYLTVPESTSQTASNSTEPQKLTSRVNSESSVMPGTDARSGAYRTNAQAVSNSPMNQQKASGTNSQDLAVPGSHSQIAPNGSTEQRSVSGINLENSANPSTESENRTTLAPNNANQSLPSSQNSLRGYNAQPGTNGTSSQLISNNPINQRQGYSSNSQNLAVPGSNPQIASNGSTEQRSASGINSENSMRTGVNNQTKGSAVTSVSNNQMRQQQGYETISQNMQMTGNPQNNAGMAFGSDNQIQNASTVSNIPMNQSSVLQRQVSLENSAKAGSNFQGNSVTTTSQGASLKSGAQKVMNQFDQEATSMGKNTINDALNEVRAGNSQILTDSNGRHIVLPNAAIDAYGKEVPADFAVVNLRDDQAKRNLANYWLRQSRSTS